MCCLVPTLSAYSFFFPLKRKRLIFEKVIQKPKGYLAKGLTVLSLLQQFHLLLLLSYLKTFSSFKGFGNSLQKNKTLISSMEISPRMVGFQI